MPTAFFGFPAVFEEDPKPNGRSMVVGAAIYTDQVSAGLGFKVFSVVLYKLGSWMEKPSAMRRRLIIFAENRTSVLYGQNPQIRHAQR